MYVKRVEVVQKIYKRLAPNPIVLWIMNVMYKKTQIEENWPLSTPSEISKSLWFLHLQGVQKETSGAIHTNYCNFFVVNFEQISNIVLVSLLKLWTIFA